MITKEKKEAIIREFARTEGDTGSPEVQVAILTARILELTEHLKAKGYAPRDIKTDSDIADWNAGKIQVGLISPAGAGHGLNIQKGGHILIWFSLVWSLEMYQQTNARLWRQGQREVVTAHHIVCRDTVDGEVLKALEHKETTQQNLIAAVKAAVGR